MVPGKILFRLGLFAALLCLAGLSASAQSPVAQAGGSFMVHTLSPAEAPTGAGLHQRYKHRRWEEPVSRWTRVRFKGLIDYLEGGDTLDQFRPKGCAENSGGIDLPIPVRFWTIGSLA